VNQGGPGVGRGARRDGGAERRPRAEPSPPAADTRVGAEEGPGVTEVLTSDVLDELRQTARPGSFATASRALADAVLALSEEDPEAALETARAAKRAAPRSAAARELLGIALYQVGEYRAARTELAAAQRISGDADLTAILADVERATGRPEQAIELFRGADRSRMSPDTAAELLIVAASAYGDLGQPGAGVALIRRNAHWPAQLADYHLRLAYAEGVLAEQAGDLDGARQAFARAVRTEPSFFDAAERLERLEEARQR
jgi:tetratricopeptide (TPR) repeat protein